MPFNVRIFGHQGLVRMKVLNAHQFSSDSVYQLSQPYLWTSGPMASSGLNPVTFTQTALPAGQSQDMTSVLRIELDDGNAIRYEVNPPGRSVPASTSSPILTGINQLQWGVGWQFSWIDATGT